MYICIYVYVYMYVQSTCSQSAYLLAIRAARRADPGAHFSLLHRLENCLFSTSIFDLRSRTAS